MAINVSKKIYLDHSSRIQHGGKSSQLCRLSSRCNRCSGCDPRRIRCDGIPPVRRGTEPDVKHEHSGLQLGIGGRKYLCNPRGIVDVPTSNLPCDRNV